VKVPNRKALLKVGYACNNNCVFCHSAPHRGHDSDLAAISVKIEQAARLGAGMLALSGGEPTIRRDLASIARIVADHGMKLGLVTNGRMLSYPDLSEQLVSLGLEYVYMSLCGADPGMHDRHAAAKAFNQALEGLGHVSGIVEDLTVNFVVTAWNLETLNEVAGLVESYAPIRLKFSMLEPEGRAFDRFEELMPDISLAAEAVVRAIKEAPSPKKLSFRIDGFPLCLLEEDLWGLESGLREDGFFIMSEAFEKNWFPVDDSNRGFGSTCLRCCLRRRCRGVFLPYLGKRGEHELRPLSGHASNSFNLEPARAPEDLDPGRCAIRAGHRPPPDPIREILVLDRENQAQRYVVSGRDFSDETLQHAIRDLGQVYKLRDKKLVSDDFATDLHRMELAGECRNCPLRPLCGGIWKAADSAPFALALEWIADRLSTLTGTVLDVGCGRLSYRSLLQPAVGDGSLSYLGIDPAPPEDPPTGFRIERAGFENFRWTGPPFDTVLSLRSLNHMSSPQDAVEKMAALTAPGGRVILVEDEVYGLLRTPATMQQVRSRGDLPFEHRVNLRLADVMELASMAGLEPVEHQSAADTASTLWCLVCRKRKS
jgi:MoaA/NifB/PqqE/SkfB family radical SAM enzyme